MNKKEIINKKIIISNRNLKKITRPSGVKFRADTSISNNRSTVRANNQALIFISAIANNIYRMKSNIEKEETKRAGSDCLLITTNHANSYYYSNTLRDLHRDIQSNYNDISVYMYSTRKADYPVIFGGIDEYGELMTAWIVLYFTKLSLVKYMRVFTSELYSNRVTEVENLYTTKLQSLYEKENI